MHILFSLPPDRRQGRSGDLQLAPRVKYDGCRLIVVRDGDRVRLFTRNGHDWSSRYPRIVESALKKRHTQFIIDGEAVVLGVDGASDFNGLHSRQHDGKCSSMRSTSSRSTARTCMRKTNLAQLLRRRPNGIFVAPFEQGEIGPDLFKRMVSKRADRPYRTGRCTHWIK